MIHRSIYDINTSTQRLHVEHGASFTPHLVTLDFFFFFQCYDIGSSYRDTLPRSHLQILECRET